MSKNIDLNLVRDLTDLGLSDKEGRAYITLLERGDMSAIGVSKYLGMHRQFVYTALESLLEKGFVIRLEGKRTKWRAQSPRKFIAVAEARQLKAASVSERLMALKEKVSGQEFEVTEGVEAFRARQLASIRRAKENSTVLMICGQWKSYFERAGDMHQMWDVARLERNISFRMIGPESLRDSMAEAVDRGITTYRVLPGLEENLVNIIIYEDEIVSEVYGDPHITFSVKNPLVAESQRHYFETLWQLAEK